MKRRHCMMWVAALAFAPAWALAEGSGLDFNVNAHAVRAAYDSEVTLSGLDFSIEALHNSDNGNVADVGLGLRSNANPGASPVTALIGVKALWVDPSYSGVSAGYGLALGGGVQFSLPSYNRIAFGAALYWAPSVTSFSNLDHFIEEEARAGYRVLPNGTVYLGYRHMTAAFTNTDDLVIDNGFNVGMALRF
ncbi:MAG TPA: YfaZ family outer membrane protein [Gammaproteobacteria bacterium]|nr:YfaZ family outer membrane protein [Gammaproteobacteria bacterium]